MRNFEHLEECMGTVFVFRGRTELEESKLQSLLAAACEKLHEADRVFSLYKPESSLSRLERGETSVADLEPVVGHIWNLCEDWEKQTGGYFSAFTPRHTFDPSGLVKTWAAQQAIDVLYFGGVTDFTFNAGGDIWLSDDLTSDVDWKIGISKPVSIASADAGQIAVVNLKGTKFRAIATSGTSERGSHIWNPTLGDEPGRELVQVSVLAKDLVTADVWATAAFAEGPRCIDRIAREPDVEVLVVYRDGRIDGSDGFAEVLRASA